MSKRRKINIGDVFGKLTVIDIKLEARGNGHPRNYAICNCQCGNSIVLLPKFLLDGYATSCRCDKPRVITGNRVKTGESKDRLYSIWYTMISRCHNENDYSYIRYGKIGIIVCDDWRNDYFTFKRWSLNNGYKDDLSIDRIDNDKSYCPENCRWATAIEQNNNQKNNIKITCFGETKTITEWCDDERCKVGRRCLNARISYGWAPEEALTKPRIGKHLAFGQVLTISEHAKREMCIINKYLLKNRVYKGWNIEEAMTTPPHGKVKTHDE